MIFIYETLQNSCIVRVRVQLDVNETTGKTTIIGYVKT